MRIIKYLLIGFLLLGCSDNSTVEIEENVLQTIKKVVDTKPYGIQNHKKGLFSYYLPKNIGVLRSNKISTVLIADNSEIFMALNVSEVMNDKLDEFLLSESDFVLIKKFETINNQNLVVNNELIIEQLADDQYLLYLKANEMFYTASVASASIESTLENMLIVSRTVNIERKLVVAEFSNKEEMNYRKQVIELFSESVPEEGFLRDIYESEKEDD